MDVAGILERITHITVLVVGDVCLDRWCRYDPSTSEPSRETGIPRIGVVETTVTPGAAGTIAGNVAALLAKQVAVLGVLGQDGFGVELERALMAREISPELVVRSSLVPTFTYTKLINADTGEEDRPRVDYIYTQPMPAEAESVVIDHLHEFWSSFDVIIVCDQAETGLGGIITPKVRDAISELAAADRGKVVWVDSRVRAEHFRNVILKCNADEARDACLRAFGTYDLPRLVEHTRSSMLVVTDGPEGVVYVRDGESRRIPTKRVDKPVDICGAGDSFSAGAAMALSITHDPEQALLFGNMVSSITIMKKGTGVASPAEVMFAANSWPQ